MNIFLPKSIIMPIFSNMVANKQIFYNIITPLIIKDKYENILKLKKDDIISISIDNKNIEIIQYSFFTKTRLTRLVIAYTPKKEREKLIEILLECSNPFKQKEQNFANFIMEYVNPDKYYKFTTKSDISELMNKIYKKYSPIHYKNSIWNNQLNKKILYRGIIMPLNFIDKIKIKGYLKIKPKFISSWTTDKKVALKFARLRGTKDKRIGNGVIITNNNIDNNKIIFVLNTAPVKNLCPSFVTQNEVLLKGTGIEDNKLLLSNIKIL